MTRLLLIILLVLSSGPAYAGWMALGENDDEITIYVDIGTIGRKGNLVKMWSLYDYKAAQSAKGIAFLSTTTQWEFDCAEGRSRVLALKEFSGNMGKGIVVLDGSVERKLEPATPESAGLTMWKIACGKR